MPSIPTEVSPQFSQLPEQNPRIVPGKALEQTGDQMQQSADYFGQIAGHLQTVQDQGMVLDAENQIAADMEKAHTGLSTWTDFTQSEQLKQTTADNLRQKYSEKYGDKPRIWRHIEPYIGQELNNFDKNVDVKSVQLTTHFNKAALLNSQLRAETDASNEPTVEGKEKVWAQQDAKTDLMVQNGSMFADEAEISKKLLRSRTITAEVDRAANPLNRPEVMESELERLKTYEGKGWVDPETMAQLQEHLGRAFEVATNRSDKVDVEKQGNALMDGYRNLPQLKDPETGEFDPLKAAKFVDDSDAPTKVKKYVRQEMEEEAGVSNKINNDRDQKQLDDLDPDVETSKLTSRQISQRMSLPREDPNFISRRVGDHLLSKANAIQRENRIENNQNRALARQERMDKSAEIRDQLLSDPAYIADEPELTPYRLKGLSPGDANIVWKSKALNADPGWKMAVGMMQNSPIYDKNTDEGRAKLSHDMLGFAKTVENKKLSGSQITDELQKELHPQEQVVHNQTVKTLLDNIWPIAKNVMFGAPLDLKIAPVPKGQAPERPKGVPAEAVWDEGTKRWNLPNK